MATVDFESWAVPQLKLTLGERTYSVRPPSVADAGKLLASALRAEVNLGISAGPLPDEVLNVLATIKPGEHPALGDVFQQLIDDGIHQATIDRMAYYAVFYWARGKGYADSIAAILWAPRELTGTAGAGEGEAPKG